MITRRALEPADYPYFDYRRFTFSLGIEAEGQVWLSGSTAVRFDAATKSMALDGDLFGQCGVVFDKMQKTLAAREMSLSDITRMTQYVTSAALPDVARLEDFRREKLRNAAPIVSTVVVKSLLREAALIEIECIASQKRAQPACIVVSAEGDPGAGDVVGQCRDAYDRLGALLGKVDADFDTVVKTTEFITPDAVPDYRRTADVRRDIFSPPYPAATGVICGRLARPGCQIFVEATALRS